MTNQNRFRLSKLALCIALAVGAVPVMAQNTTSALGGRITSADGKPVNGAQITIVHKESGSTNSATTDAEGRYSARGLRVGGPYTITITKDGVTEKRENVFLQLAETASLDAKLGGAAVTQLETIAVTAQGGGSDKFSNTAMGAGTSIGRNELDTFASIQRNLQDYARTDPRVAQTDKGRGEISVGGQNSRYNKITVDSVNISDTFGLEANGLPTLKQPISIDAIQSVQVNVSNYDVTQTGYTGGGINAVTKSGTNEFHGTVSVIGRNEKFVGQRYNFGTTTYSDVANFKESTFGATLGGPIIKDTLFFFANYEQLKSTRNTPDFGPLGSSASTIIGITPTAISSAQSLAQSRYGFNVGSTSSKNDLEVKDALVKLDWNINKNHRASVRYTKTEQTEPLYPNFFDTPSTALSLSSNWYVQEKTIETVVGQWFADWTPNLSTEAKVSSRDYNSVPKNNANLPQVSLSFTGALPVGTPSSVLPGTRNLLFGTERSRHTNLLDTKTVDGYFGANYGAGAHEFKLAGDYQDNKIFNAFLQDTKGNYTFNCQPTNAATNYTYTFGTVTCANAVEIERAVLENFSRGRPTTYSVQVPAQAGGSLDDGIARFNIRNYGLALQDTWTVSPNLTVMYGVRLDTPSIPQTPLRNNAAAAPLIAGSGTTRQSGGFGLDNTVTIDGKELIQPRIGFNYTFESQRPMQLRGGVGLFQGAAASVWLSNGFSNTGIATRLVGCGGGFAACPADGGVFSADPANQRTNFVGAAPAAGVDFIDSKLAQPSVWKGNLAFDMELPWGGIVAGFEYLYTKTETGIFYQNLNLGAPTSTGAVDGRQFFYTASALNAACWSATGARIVTGPVCGVDNRTRALSNPAFANVLLAKKTNQGRGDLATVSLSGMLYKQLSWSLAYTYTDAKEVSGLTSSVSNSNWASRAALNPNEENATNSAYLVKDRINATLNWQRAFFPGFKTTVGLFYEGRSGKPYSWTFANDINGDALAGNDLLYIPKAPGSGEVVFVGDTATDKTNENRFWSIVNDNSALSSSRGTSVKRNDSFSPWTNNIDMRLSQQVPSFFKGHKAVFVLDILNVGNLINKKWGHINEAGFQTNGGNRLTFVNFAGLDAQGRYRYIVSPKADDFRTRDDRLESQWALQATFRYEF